MFVVLSGRRELQKFKQKKGFLGGVFLQKKDSDFNFNISKLCQNKLIDKIYVYDDKQKIFITFLLQNIYYIKRFKTLEVIVFKEKKEKKFLYCKEKNNFFKLKKFLLSFLYSEKMLINYTDYFDKQHYFSTNNENWLNIFNYYLLNNKIDKSKKTICFYFPTCAYREQQGSLIDKILQTQKFNVLVLVGSICEDEFEKKYEPLLADLQLRNTIDFVDLWIVPTIMNNFSAPGKKVLFVHDVHDSPYGTLDSQISLLPKLDCYFLPSKPVVERLLWFLEIAKEKEMTEKKQYTLITGGYPKLDNNLKYFKQINGEKKVSNMLIFAPTVIQPAFEKMVAMPDYTEDILESLLLNFPDYKIIFRPHPHTHKKYVEPVVEKFSKNKNFTFDNKKTFYMDNYAKSKIMITDMSGTAYTYAFTTLRPVVFFSHNEQKTMSEYGDLAYFKDREKVGVVVTSVLDLSKKVKYLLDNYELYNKRIKNYRDGMIFNIGNSEQYFINHISQILNNQKVDEWEYFK